MRIAIVGSHGIPANYGGFETFAEEISVLFQKSFGHNVTVVCDSDQESKNRGIPSYQGVALRYSRHSKSRSAIFYYMDSIRQVVPDHDIIYSCGPAGGLFGHIVRRQRKLLFINPDGLNSRRSKWNRIVRAGFSGFEWMTTRFSDLVVCDSNAVEAYIQSRYGCRRTAVIEYGAHPNPFVELDDSTGVILRGFSLAPMGYHLIVARLEPENNVDMIIRGFQRRGRKYPLVIAGNLNGTAYVEQLRRLAGSGVRFLGGVYGGKALSVLRAQAFCYLHGHSVGGTNPSLLEAMASRNLCVCHDNAFNREVVGDNGLFFRDEGQLDGLLSDIEGGGMERFGKMRSEAFNRIVNHYNWERIACRYNELFTSALNGVRH